MTWNAAWEPTYVTTVVYRGGTCFAEAAPPKHTIKARAVITPRASVLMRNFLIMAYLLLAIAPHCGR
jgi:hypothetical protein